MSSDTATIPKTEHDAAVAERDAEIARLRETVAKLQHMLWGRRSEKQVLPPGAPFQSQLFTQGDVQIPAPEKKGEDKDDSSPRSRGRGRKKPRFGPNVERQVVDLELPAGERACGKCGEELRDIGFESAERAHFIPARLVVIEERRHKYACRCQEAGVRTAPGKPTAFPKAQVTDEFRAHVIVSKFVDHCPYYRQSAILRRAGFRIADSTLGRWAIEGAHRAAPVILAMHEELLACSYLQADETGIPVLKTEREAPGAHRGTLWGYGRPHGTVVFDYTSSKEKCHPTQFLAKFRGVLQNDRAGSFAALRLNVGVIDSGCWAHARRRFVDAERLSGGRVPILEPIQRLYQVERHARERQMSPDERCALRKLHALPILAEIRAMLDDLLVSARPESKLGDAVRYASNHWASLVVYVEYGEVEIDNNWIENSMRPIALGRKNYMFAGSEIGAEAAAILYSLTESCRRLAIDPHGYLVHLYDRLAVIDPTNGDEVRALTPARRKLELPAPPTP
jgi:transposase